MEKLKYNTPYPASRLKEVSRGQRLSVVTGPDIRCGHLEKLEPGLLQLSNGFALSSIPTARLKCIHLFDGECTRNCSSPEQFRPCDGRCPRMRCYDKKSPNPHKQPGRAASD